MATENTLNAALPTPTAAEPDPPPRLGDRLRDAYHRIFDVPDYRAYLRHVREHHPDIAPMSEREFAARFIDRRYGSKGPRCC